MTEKEKELYKKLIERFCENKASDAELAIFFQLLKEGKLDELMSDSMKTVAGIDVKDEKENIDSATVVKLKVWKWPRASIAIILAASVITCLLYVSRKAHKAPEYKTAINNKTNQLKNDAAPGTNKAILTLANGNTMVLDSASNGTLAMQGTVNIVNKDGQLTYNDKVKEKNEEIVYNKMETQRGGQYQLILADGSKVWLNAASSIRFPNIFSGNERVVEITGELYFEVVKNTAMPFKVKINTASGNGGEIEVLGTHFNVNAYNNETTIKSSLLEGSIKLKNNTSESKGSGQVILKPGQQAQINKQGAIKIEDNTDMEEVVAWKNGMFQFNKATIEVIMRQVERWYNVDVVYIGEKPPGHYHGEISRNVNASEMLRVLQTSGIHFNIEDGKIIVSP